MRPVHILVVDDEPSLLSVLEPVLSAAGHEVATATDAASALSQAAKENPDVILLDLGLPDLDGKEVIRRIRDGSNAAIIVISARHQEAEKIAALDEGADDYVDKPFEIGELMARIRAAVRRANIQENAATHFSAGRLAIDFSAREIRLAGEVIRLSPKEFDLIATLAKSAGQVVTHRRLLTAGWGPDVTDTQYLRVYIGMLRQKIEENPSDPRLLLTEPGVGYRLIGQSSSEENDD